MTATSYQTQTAAVVAGTAYIDSGETTTATIVLDSKQNLALVVPVLTSAGSETSDQTTFTFEGQAFSGGEFETIADEDGLPLTVQVVAGESAPVPEIAAYFYAIKIVANVAQAATRAIQFVASSPASNIIFDTGDAVTANQGTKTATSTNAWLVQGGDAIDAPFTNTPLGVGGRASSASPSAVATGDAQALWLTPQGATTIAPNGASVASDALGYSSATFISADGGSTFLGTTPYLFNDTLYDRERNNIAVTLAASAARTATLTVATQTNYNGAMLHAVITVSTITIGGITPVIKGIGKLGTTYPLLTGAVITTAGQTVLKIGPGFAATANVSAADMLPRLWNMVVTPVDGNSITYSIEANVNE